MSSHCLAMILPLVLCQIPVDLAAPVLMEPKVQAGAAYVSRETIHRSHAIGPRGTKIEKSDVTVTWKTEFKPTQGTKVVTGMSSANYIDANLELPGGVVRFDSTNPNVKGTSPLQPLMRDYFLKLKEHSVSWHPGGEHRRVTTGIDFVDNNYVIGSFADWSPLPESAVTPGETWNVVQNLRIDNLRTLVLDRRYEYIGSVTKQQDGAVARQIDKIRAQDVSVRYEDKGEPNTVTAKLRSADVAVSRTDHVYLFDRALGRIIERQGELRVHGPLKYELGGEEMDWAIDFRIEYHCEEVSPEEGGHLVPKQEQQN
jgi:hypothetical protein